MIDALVRVVVVAVALRCSREGGRPVVGISEYLWLKRARRIVVRADSS